MKRELYSNNTKVSIVIPVYNEKETLSVLHRRLLETFERWNGQGWNFQIEVVLVNDGSSDGSGDIMDEYVKNDRRFKVIHLSRNFGHQEALTAGLSFINSSCIVVLDADLQDPPELIDVFLEKWVSGYDVVYGIRRKREENIVLKMFYIIFYRLYKLMAHIEIPLDAGDFCLMDNKVIRVLNQLPERIRFIRGLRSWAGFAQCGIEYDRQKRQLGMSKYSFIKLVQLACTGFFGFSTIPLRIATTLGFLSMSIGFAFALFILVQCFAGFSILGFHPSDSVGYTSIFAGMMVFAGFQLLALGVIGEYIGLLYFETKGRPTFIIRSINGKLNENLVPFGIDPNVNSLRVAEKSDS
jgi:polyisoprenyl-phosphate glycosyltransferase